MVRPSTSSILFFALGIALILAATTLSCRESAAAEAELQVALIDVSQQPPLPPGLLDLMLARLSREGGIALLERQELAAVLEEQEHGLVWGNGVVNEKAVAVGQVLGADALVLLSAEPANEQGIQPVEVRIVETRRGVRFGKTMVAWEADSQAIDRQIESVTHQVVKQLRHVRQSRGGFTVVSVAGFQTAETSQEAHRVRRDLEAWLGVWLANQPGILVAERDRVLPLIEERRVSTNLPDALGDSDAVVHGSFRIDLSTPRPRVRLTVRVAHKDGPSDQRELDGELADLSRLRGAVGVATLGMLSAGAAPAELDPPAEVALLLASAERLNLIGRRREAANRLTAAYALEPDNFRVQAWLVSVGVCADRRTDGPAYWSNFYEEVQLLSDVARRLIDGYGTDRADGETEWRFRDRGVLQSVLRFCRAFCVPIRDTPSLDPRYTAEHEWCRAAIEDLFESCLAATKSTDTSHYTSVISLGLDDQPVWSRSPEEAFLKRRELLNLAAEGYRHEKGNDFLRLLTSTGPFLVERTYDWRDNPEFPGVLKAYLEDLAASEDPFLRARGMRGLAGWSYRYQKDRDRAEQLYERFIDVVVNEIIAQEPGIGCSIGNDWIEYYDLHESFLSDRVAGEQWARLVSACWSHSTPASTSGWDRRITKTVECLERTGQVEKAEGLLRLCIDRLQTDMACRDPDLPPDQRDRTKGRLKILLAELSSRHPEAGSAAGALPVFETTCEVVLSLDHLSEQLRQADKEMYRALAAGRPARVAREPSESELNSMLPLWHFLGATPTKDGYAFVCGHDAFTPSTDPSRPHTSYRFVLARTDRHGELKGAELHPEPVERDPHPKNGLQKHVIWPMASRGEEVFVVCANSILWVREGRPTVHFSAEFLADDSPTHRPVPFKEIHEVVPVADKLFVRECVDASRSNIYEWDCREGVATKLWNAFEPRADSPLFGREVCSIMAGPNDTLLVWAGTEYRRGKRPANAAGGDLFLLNPGDRSVRQSGRPLFLSYWFFWRLSDYQPFRGVVQAIGYGAPDGALAIFDPNAAALDWYVSSERPQQAPPKLVMAGLAANGRWILATQKREGETILDDWQKYHSISVWRGASAEYDWLLFKRGNPVPVRLSAPDLPPPSEVKMFFMNDDDQVLMMTSKRVFRVALPEGPSRQEQQEDNR